MAQWNLKPSMALYSANPAGAFLQGLRKEWNVNSKDHPEPLSAEEDALVEIGRRLVESRYNFSTVTPATHARVLARTPNKLSSNLRDVFGWSRPFTEDFLPASLVAPMRRARVIEAAESGVFQSTIRFSTLDALIFMHSAYPTSASDAVFFGPDTVRFVASIRAHLAARQTPIMRAADVGSGAGPGAIAVATLLPRARVWMLDINRAALSASRVNAALNGVHNAISVESDVLAAVDGDFDLIVANPPYLIDAAARAYRHGGGELGEGLSLRILREAASRLAIGGSLHLYTGSVVVEGRDYFSEAAELIADEFGFAREIREIDPDVFGEELETPCYRRADRIAAVALTMTRTAK